MAFGRRQKVAVKYIPTTDILNSRRPHGPRSVCSIEEHRIDAHIYTDGHDPRAAVSTHILKSSLQLYNASASHRGHSSTPRGIQSI